jgi:signal transduction histidine kinase
LLNKEGQTREKSQYYTDIVINSSNQLLSIITDIISIATIEAGQEKVNPSQFGLNSLLKLIYQQYAVKNENQKIQINLKSTLRDGDDMITSDETKISQIVSNLLNNSLKFTKEGQINLGYEIIENGKSNYLQFFVEDTGIGIPDHLQEEIFKRFRQVESTQARTYGGSGLGLSIAKAYVELLGGKMWLKSELDKGSTFYFTIPYKTN